jgi:ribosome biogenesis GTPase
VAKKGKGQKHRVAFRKNREKRARRNDLTRDVLKEDQAESGTVADLAADERVSGKGALTRYRTVVGVEEDESGQLVREIDESKCIAGRVVSAIGQNSIVQGADGTRYECSVRRVVRTLARDAKSAVVTGDRVQFQPTGQTVPSGLAQGVIERVEPRRGMLSRGTGGREHIIVSNVDQVVIVGSAADPPLKTNLVDRFLVSAGKGQTRAIVCINKADLIDPAELQPVLGLYAQLGYDALLTSVATGRGIAALRRLLDGRESVFAGQSGVGKSSLLNAVEPDWELKTGAVSEWTQKGRHTTRRAVLLELESGGWVVDTPGVRQFGLWDVIPEEVEAYFVEFRPFVTRCRFPDCSHTHEDGCGVKWGVEHGLIHEVRYESYLRIIHGDDE